MTIFYDPQKRQPQAWVIPTFILMVIVLAVVVWVYGQNQAKVKGAHTEQQVDIFAR